MNSDPTAGKQPNEKGRFACDFCGKSYTWKESVYLHQRKVHGRESASKRQQYQGKFPCEVCGKKLASTQRLKHHVKAKHNIQQ